MVRNVSRLVLEAEVGRVWAALTDPELVKQWQYGSDLITTWEVGQPIRFRIEWQGGVFEQWGTVLEFQPLESLRYSLFAPRADLEDRPENYFTMSYSLRPANGQVVLEIVQEDERPGAVQEAVQGADNPVLAGLKVLVEQA